MPTVNRYSKLSTPRYTPRSLEEMMVAPAYMRGEHDKLDASREMLRAQTASADGLDIHEGRLAEAQQKLYGQMDENAEKLLNQGFSPSAKSDFYKFNADYQQAVGPKGDIGRIQAAKAAYTSDKANLMKNATAMGLSPASIERNIKERYAQYGEEFAATGDIKNMEMPMPPAYQDMQQDLNSLKSNLGETVTQAMNNGELEIITNDNGLLVYNQLRGFNRNSDNFTQLQAGLDKLNAKWFDGGPGDQFSQWEGLDEDYRRDFLTGGINSMRNRSNIDGRYYDQVIPEAPKGNTGGESFYENVTVASAAIKRVGKDTTVEKLESASQEVNAAVTKEAIENLTPEQLDAKMIYEHVEREYRNSFSSDEEYFASYAEVDRLEQAFKDTEDDIRKSNKYNRILENDRIANENARTVTRGGKDHAIISNDAEIYLNSEKAVTQEAWHDAKNYISKKRNGVLENYKQATTTYAIVPKAKGVKEKTAFDKGFASILGGAFDASKNYVTFKHRVGPDGDVLERVQLDFEDQEDVARMLHDANPANVTISGITPSDVDGSLGVNVTLVNTKKYKDEKITIQMSLDDLYAQGYNAAGGYLLEYLETVVATDGPKSSRELAYRIRRQYELRPHEGKTWSQIQNEGLTTNDPNLNYDGKAETMRIYMKEAYEDFARKFIYMNKIKTNDALKANQAKLDEAFHNSVMQAPESLGSTFPKTSPNYTK